MEKIKRQINNLKHVAEEVFVESARKDASGGQLKSEILNEETRRRKALAVVEMIRRVLPDEINRLIKNRLDQGFDPENLPFNIKKLSLDEERIGKGYVSEVYLLESREEDVPSYVLKINYQAKGPLENIHQEALNDKNEYQQIRELFQSIPDLVPEEFQLIAESPKTKKPAVMTVQRFMGRNFQDIFKMDRRELTDALDGNSELKDSFCRFVDISQKLWAEKRQAIDLLGETNLALADGRKLVFLDPHNISSKEKSDEKRMQRLEECLKYLQDVRDEISREDELDEAA